MTRLTSPSFALFSCALPDTLRDQTAQKIAAELLPEFMKEPPNPQSMGAPVVLRWATAPMFGFPRQPFNVYRRFRRYAFSELDANVTGTSGAVMMAEWGKVGMYEVRFQGRPDSGQSLIVEAVDCRGEVIPGQRLVFTSTRMGLLRASGIVALRLRGRGIVSDITGISMQRLANESDWTLIEIVGLPLTESEISPTAYQSDPQGFESPSVDGVTAAKIRLLLAATLHRSPPTPGDPTIPTPDWKAPDINLYLDYLRQASPGMVEMICKCLENTSDDSLTDRQVQYIYETTVEGIRQADLPGAVPGRDPTELKIPVIGTTMLAATGDSYAATALGYGTIDFPPFMQMESLKDILLPSGIEFTPFDYMVTAWFGFPFGIKQEYAALAMPRSLPEIPMSLTARSHQQNRAPFRDEATTESVKLSWNLSLLPQGYAIAESEFPGTVKILNSPRPKDNGFEPFIPLRLSTSEGAPQPNARTTFTDPVSIVPISGTKQTRYLVAGLDVFGRWSAWQLTNYSVSAPPVQKPGLHSIRILIDGNPSGRIQPCKLEIEFSWNWSDRSPDRIEFTGNFFTGTTPPMFTSGFALDAIAPVEPTIVVRFNSAGVPSLAAPAPGSPTPSGTVTELNNPPDPDLRRYRMILNAFSCDFTGKNEIKFAVYAAAAERIRPTFLSDRVGASIAKLADPIPPDIPSLPIDLRWTALPDVTGQARGVLRWDAVPGAVGYVLYEATESALRHMINPSRAVPIAGASLRDRASELRTMITESSSSQARSMLAFSRLNTDLISRTEMEIELPAASSTLYVYRIAAVNSAKVESARSSQVAIFAVPKLNVPGQPRLLLRVANKVGSPTGIRVIASPGADAAVHGYCVFRVRSEALLSDVGTKGLPKILPNDPRWEITTLPSIRGSGEPAHAILDTVAPSWYPYYYQLVAIGFENTNAGEYAGESIPSAVQSAVLPPIVPPVLTAIGTTAANSNSRLITFQTDLPVKETPLGSASIEITRIRIVGDRPERSALLRVNAQDVRQITALSLSAIPIPTATITRRAAIAATGIAEYTALLPPAPAGTTEILSLTVRDPLGRITEIQL